MKKTTVGMGLVVLVMLMMVVGCGSNGEVKEDMAAENQPQSEPEADIVTTASGLRYMDLVVGEGTVADNGMEVEVNYTLWLDENGEKGRKIDSSHDRNQLFPFTVGQPGLIRGWNEGMLGMMPGGTRRLYVPSDLGYGPNGRPPVIPGGADLIFEIELVNIK
jgi:FKBP-type peptidyl-prolyl cis-trans isomerase